MYYPSLIRVIILKSLLNNLDLSGKSTSTLENLLEDSMLKSVFMVNRYHSTIINGIQVIQDTFTCYIVKSSYLLLKYGREHFQYLLFLSCKPLLISGILIRVSLCYFLELLPFLYFKGYFLFILDQYFNYLIYGYLLV